VENLLLKLADRLKNLSGKKVYGYLPPDVKATVDLIVDELAKDDRLPKHKDWNEDLKSNHGMAALPAEPEQEEPAWGISLS
jgi:hypothetical protein